MFSVHRVATLIGSTVSLGVEDKHALRVQLYAPSKNLLRF